MLAKGQRHNDRSGSVTFFVYRASSDPDLFVVSDRESTKRFPPAPKRGTWLLFKVFPETGKPRIGFSEAEAKHDIAKQGFHFVRVSVQVPEAAAAETAHPARVRHRAVSS